MKTKLTILLSLLTAIPILTISPSEAKTSSCGTIVEVFDPNDTHANVRPSPNGQILAEIPNGTPAFVNESRSDGDWKFVYFIGDNAHNAFPSGYIRSNLLSSKTYYVKDEKDGFVNLRAAPNGRVLRQVPNGTPIDILPSASVEKDMPSWVKVRLGNGDRAVGYMSNDLVHELSCR